MDGADLPIPTDACMVLVLGETGAGKSYFIRKLTANSSVKVGHNLESCTVRSQAFEAKIGGTNLLLIDTPGFDDSVRSDGDVVLEIATSLLAQAAMGVRLLGIIYVHDITATRMRGSLKRELEMLKLIAGPKNYRHVLLVTTKWGDVSRRREFENRQYELEEDYWETLIQGHAEIHRFEGTSESARSIVSQLNFGTNAELALQKELLSDMTFRDTSVGKYAEGIRREQQQELSRLSAGRMFNTNSDKVVELEASLQRSASDAQKMNIKLNEQVKEWIQEAVKEEKRSSKKRPTVSKAMDWVLTATSRFFARFEKEKSEPSYQQYSP